MRTAFKSSNPALSSKSFGGFVGAGARGGDPAMSATQNTGAMTMQGTVDKTASRMAVVIFTAIWPWRLFFESRNPELLLPWLGIGAIGGFVVAMITIFKKTWAPATAPIYAACEGLVLGSTSALFELQYPGIVLRSVALTFGVLLTLLVAYRSGAIRATPGFRRGVIAATGAIVLVYIGWYGAFGLLVTLVWLYLEILRLLAKLNNRR